MVGISYFNPRIPYGMRRAPPAASSIAVISIHASRMGCDYLGCPSACKCFISIHASRMGCDWSFRIERKTVFSFQSTHPVWDATRPCTLRGCSKEISIHASRMGCDNRGESNLLLLLDFNPRIPYGMRQKRTRNVRENHAFQSTHPVWDATTFRLSAVPKEIISIHASRMGCDLSKIRAVRGGKFQSTHPVWDATSGYVL